MRIPFLGFLACLSLSAHAQIQLSGNVYDVDGKPKAGVVISLAQAGLSDTTDATGAWSLVSDVQSVAPRTLDRSRWNGRDLSLQLEKTSLVRAELFDARGARVGERFERLLGPGAHAVRLTSREVVGGRWLRLSVDGQMRVLSGASGLSASPSEVPAPLARSAESLERLIYRFQGQILTEDVLSTLIKAGIQKWIQGHLIKGNVLLDPRVKLDTVYAYFDGGRMTSVRRARVGYSADLKEYSGMFFTIRDDNNGQIAYRTWIEVLGNGIKKVGVSDTVNFNSDFGQITVPTFRLGNAIPTPVITGGSPVARNVPNTFVVDPQDAGKDILSITWTDGTGWSATGRTIQRTWPKRGEQRLKVEVVDVEGNRDSAVRRVYVDTAVPNALAWHDSLGYTTVLQGDLLEMWRPVDSLEFKKVRWWVDDTLDGKPLQDSATEVSRIFIRVQWLNLGQRTIRIRSEGRYGGVILDSMVFRVKDWITDARDGRRYPVVVIGGQRWFASNLAYAPGSGEKFMPDSLLARSSTTFPGPFYSWVQINGLPDSCSSAICSTSIGRVGTDICPQGWKVPSLSDWNVLRRRVATIFPVSGKMYPFDSVALHIKSVRGWINPKGANPFQVTYGSGGSDDLGLEIRPNAGWSPTWVDNSGWLLPGGFGIEARADYWVSDEDGAETGKVTIILPGNKLSDTQANVSGGVSKRAANAVRCVEASAL